MGTSLSEILDDADDASVDPDASRESDAPAPTPKATRSRAARGPLLDLPEDQAAKRAMREIRRREPTKKRLKARWKANRLRRAGVAGVELVKSSKDEASYEVWAPPSTDPLLPIPNKANTLCRRLTSHLFVDPPVPDAAPETDQEDDIEAAELATRVLTVEAEDIRLNAKMRRAFSLAGTYGSGFVRFYVDQTAGGFRPKMVTVPAETPDGTPEDQAVVSTGADGQASIWGGELVTRYVTPQGAITREPAQAAQQWLPKIRAEVITPKGVSFYPESADGIDEAEGVILEAFKRVGELKNLFPDHPLWRKPALLRQLADKRPDGTDDLLQPSERKRVRAADANEPASDDALLYTHTHVFTACRRYPRGAYCVFVGDQVALDRREWVEEREDGTIALLDLPVAQVKQFGDEDDDDLAGGFGQGVMDLIGGPNELRVIAMVAIADHLEDHRNRKTFLPISSTLQPRQLQAPGRTVLPINPGNEPKYEEIPDFPQTGVELLDRVNTDMDDIVGLQAIAQGLTDPSVQSGFHATQIVEQAIVGLSDVRENVQGGYTRAWRVLLQQIRVNYSTEQERRYLGDGNDYVVTAFRGADLDGAKDVLIARGSGTMMTPSAKAAMAEHLASSNLIDAHELKRLISSNVGGMIGLQDDPHEQRIKRQLRRWMLGIPKAIQAQLQQDQQAAQLLAQQQAMGLAPPPLVGPDGQPVPPPPAPGQQMLQQYAQELFDRRPIDEMPDVAMVRYLAMTRAAGTTKYADQSPEWRQVFDVEWAQMRQWAGAMTLQEQADAQAADRKPPAESINYKDVPPDIQRQMEAQAGFQPSQMSPDEHRTHVAAMHAGEGGAGAGPAAGQNPHPVAHPNPRDPGAPKPPKVPGAVSVPT